MNEPALLSLEFELSIQDHRAMLRHLCSQDRRARIVSRLAWMALVFGAFFFASLLPEESHFGAGMSSGLLLFFAWFFYSQLSLARRLQPSPNGAVLCAYCVRVGNDGFTFRTPHWYTELPWKSVLGIEEIAQHYFVRIDTASAYTLPKRAFVGVDAARRFRDFARTQANAARAVASPA